jgi:hypothetical protein
MRMRAQTLEADVSGTSIRWSYDAAGGVLTLSGLDAVANYRRVLASVRYRNPGSLVPIPGRTPVVNVLTFSPGTRTLTVTLSDGAGGTAVAEATVTCVATPRVGTPGRDPALPAAQDCSGNGTIVLDALTVRALRMPCDPTHAVSADCAFALRRATRPATACLASKATCAKSRPVWATASSPRRVLLRATTRARALRCGSVAHACARGTTAR